MRIISGLYKGRKLQVGQDLSIRPTTDRVKEFIFNVLQDFPQNKIVADIFSGSGNLGLEALSRGSKHVIFVEKNISSINVLKNNIAGFSLTPSTYTIIQKTAEDFHVGNLIDLEHEIINPILVESKYYTILKQKKVSRSFISFIEKRTK